MIQPSQEESVSPVADLEAGERSRIAAIREGACAAAVQGGGENYLSAFAVLLNASPLQIGLLSSLPQVVGTWSQAVSAKMLNRRPHRKTLMLAGVAGQTFMWLPLLTLPLLVPNHGPLLLIACAVAYFAFGHFATPAWSSLMTDLVDPNSRGQYFARRAKVMAVTSFAALCLAGLLLHAAKSWETTWAGFALVFLAVAAMRLLSLRYLAHIDEKAAPPTRETDAGLVEFLRHEHSENFRNFLWFSGLIHVATLVAGPFFVVYFLRDLHLTYLEYALWMATGVIGQFMTLKPWGAISDRFGNKKILVVTGFLVPFLPMLYLLSTNFLFVATLNFFGGVVWGGLALALQNYVYDTVKPENRAKGVAVYNIVNAGGWFVGSMLGGWLAGIIPSQLAIGPLTIRAASSLPFVFFVSGLLRLFVSVTMLRRFRETRAVEQVSPCRLVAELPLVKPLLSAFVPRSGVQSR